MQLNTKINSSDWPNMKCRSDIILYNYPKDTSKQKRIVLYEETRTLFFFIIDLNKGPPQNPKSSDSCRNFLDPPPCWNKGFPDKNIGISNLIANWNLAFWRWLLPLQGRNNPPITTESILNISLKMFNI